MKHKSYSENQNRKPATVSMPPATAVMEHEVDFAPSSDEVARRAYFTYVNQGSRQGHEVQHWLEAEAELIAERNLTRVHGFHNRS
jgi:Protein of unknown function (DUF2934)